MWKENKCNFPVSTTQRTGYVRCHSWTEKGTPNVSKCTLEHSALNPINCVGTTLSAFCHRSQTQSKERVAGNNIASVTAVANQCYFKVHKMSSGPPVKVGGIHSKETSSGVIMHLLGQPRITHTLISTHRCGVLDLRYHTRRARCS